MTYDQWKTTDPRDYEPEEPQEPFGSCDCCEAREVPLTRCWAYGIETFACDECREPPEQRRTQAVAPDDEITF